MRHVLFALVLAGCASGSGQQPTTNTAGTQKNGMVCKDEAPVGSSISREVCRSPEQVEGDRKNADDWLRNQSARPGQPNN